MAWDVPQLVGQPVEIAYVDATIAAGSAADLMLATADVSVLLEVCTAKAGDASALLDYDFCQDHIVGRVVRRARDEGLGGVVLTLDNGTTLIALRALGLRQRRGHSATTVTPRRRRDREDGHQTARAVTRPARASR
jgi:hypothetical protein